MITNQENQKERNKEKWLESNRLGRDMSGRMEWCFHCPYGKDLECLLKGKQDFIDKNHLCAKAYNKMRRRSKL